MPVANPTAAGGSITILGATVYPAPVFVYLIAATSPTVLRTTTPCAFVPLNVLIPTSLLIVTAGTNVYPAPGFVIVIEVTMPAALIDAIPVAVVPLVGGAIVIGGAEIYFPPVFVILNDVIVPPALTVTVAAAPTVVGLNTTFGISPYSSPCWAKFY